jgi:hypothetical protein
LLHEDSYSIVPRDALEDGRLLAIVGPKHSYNHQLLLPGGLEINSFLSHANIVSLIGYCVEIELLILVYDFIHQRTLEDHLHGTRTRHRNPFLVGESSKS